MLQKLLFMLLSSKQHTSPATHFAVPQLMGGGLPLPVLLATVVAMVLLTVVAVLAAVLLTVLAALLLTVVMLAPVLVTLVDPGPAVLVTVTPPLPEELAAVTLSVDVAPPWAALVPVALVWVVVAWPWPPAPPTAASSSKNTVLRAPQAVAMMAHEAPMMRRLALEVMIRMGPNTQVART
jgi:hypothetical protein